MLELLGYIAGNFCVNISPSFAVNEFHFQINPPSKLSPGSAPVNFLILEKVFQQKCLPYLNVRFDLFTAVCRRGLMGHYNEKWLVSPFSV